MVPQSKTQNHNLAAKRSPDFKGCRGKSKTLPLLLGLLFTLNFTVSGQSAESEAVATAHVKSQLVSAVSAIEPGQPFDVALRFVLDEHWHTYYKKPGDSGLATSIDWTLPEGFTASDITWPNPQRLPFGPLTNFGYEGTVLHVVTITPPVRLKPGESVTLKARGDWLVCEEICIPGSAEYELKLPVRAAAAPSKWTAAFSEFRDQQPQALDNTTFHRSKNLLLIELPTILPDTPLAFFPDQEGIIDNTVFPQLITSGNGSRLSVPLAGNTTLPAELTGRLVASSGDSASFSIAATPAESKDSSDQITSGFLLTVLFGFLGGLILNLMPCVFPVLGIKVMGFVQQAGEDRKKVIAHGLAFTAGVLASFWLLAGVLLILRTSGQELGWGFQLQSPGFVFALMVFLFAFGLNLSGLFEFGTSAVGIGSGSNISRSGATGSFFSGVLATVVATPCAAPFLAPALGAALSLPAVYSFILFTSIALGLSAPYLMLSLKPELTRFLPRPGAWMESFKQAMAFPLFATAAYLLWVLDGQVAENQLLHIFFALAAIALALWIYGRWSTPARSAATRKIAVVSSLLLLSLTLIWAWPKADSAAAIEWQPWSKQTEQQLIGEGRTVYVDFTARWCATCQTNKAIVFSNDEIIRTFKDLNIATLKADWTNQDPNITRELASFNRSAVPFNLIYHPGTSEPTILPELLTPGIVLDALEGMD
jgi:thiol:disulfide interchange protein DsbD